MKVGADVDVDARREGGGPAAVLGDGHARTDAGAEAHQSRRRARRRRFRRRRFAVAAATGPSDAIDRFLTAFRCRFRRLVHDGAGTVGRVSVDGRRRPFHVFLLRRQLGRTVGHGAVDGHSVPASSPQRPITIHALDDPATANGHTADTRLGLGLRLRGTGAHGERRRKRADGGGERATGTNEGQRQTEPAGAPVPSLNPALAAQAAATASRRSRQRWLRWPAHFFLLKASPRWAKARAAALPPPPPPPHRSDLGSSSLLAVVVVVDPLLVSADERKPRQEQRERNQSRLIFCPLIDRHCARP